MTSFRLAGPFCALVLIALLPLQPSRAQEPPRAQEPSAVAAALGREIIELKGGINIFDLVIDGVVEHHRRLLLQSDPNLDTDLTEVAKKLRVELVSRRPEIHAEIGRAYAVQFTEPELRQIAAFYKTPLGKKLIDGEPKAIDEATKRIDVWSTKFAEEVMEKMKVELRKKGHNQL